MTSMPPLTRNEIVEIIAECKKNKSEMVVFRYSMSKRRVLKRILDSESEIDRSSFIYRIPEPRYGQGEYSKISFSDTENLQSFFLFKNYWHAYAHGLRKENATIDVGKA